MHATGEDGGRRLALVIATSSYADPTLASLRAPGQDAEDLSEILGDAAIGGFAVDLVLNAPADAVRRRVARFCAEGAPRDLALIYLSCHGVLDDRGRLYYATTDTDRELLSVTAIQAMWLNEHLEDCRCRQQILVLDCCHSGAFAKGAKGDGDLALRKTFEGRGRVVLTASRATEYSFEGDRVVGESASSVFTGALVNGLSTGDADADHDGLITVTELYDYAYQAVRRRETRQTPCLWSYGAEGSLLIAHSPRGAVVEPAPLPDDLVAALESPRPRVRESAVAELADVLAGPDAGRALTARDRLARVAADDIPLVAGAAQDVLDDDRASPASPSSGPSETGAAASPPRPSLRQPARNEHPLARLRARLPARPRLLAEHKTLVAVALVALGLTAGAIALLQRDSGSSGDSVKTGPILEMRPVDGAKEAATANLVQYSTPPVRLVLELSPKETRHQLLLFDDLSSVRSFRDLPTSAEIVKGDDSQDLRSQYEETGADLPPYFRRYRYFGVVSVSGAARKLTLYNRTDQLLAPR